jgi:hypothetical protein
MLGVKSETKMDAVTFEKPCIKRPAIIVWSSVNFGHPPPENFSAADKPPDSDLRQESRPKGIMKKI